MGLKTEIRASIFRIGVYCVENSQEVRNTGAGNTEMGNANVEIRRALESYDEEKIKRWGALEMWLFA